MSFSQLYIQASNKNIVVSGKVFDSKSGEVLINATIYNRESIKGTTTNSQGYYSLELDSLPAYVVASYIGYRNDTLFVESQNTIQNVYLNQSDNEIDEVVISSISKDNSKSQVSSFLVNKSELLNVPSIASESDLTKYLQLTPGVSFGGDGNSNLYVRGGSHDQNLFLLDNMPLFHISHFGGFFSTFNSDIINSAVLYKGGFPARFGGRLSSVVDVHTYDGDLYNLNGKATLGLLFSKFAINGPVKLGKSSYNFTVRKNTLPVFKIIGGENIDFNFWDVNLKLSNTLSDRDKVYFSLYAGNDLFGFSTGDDSLTLNKNKVSWGNKAGSIRYNRIFSPVFFGNFSIGFSNYHYNEYDLMKIGLVDSTIQRLYENDFKSSITCGFMKAQFEYHIQNNLKIIGGYELNLFKFSPGRSYIVKKNQGKEENLNLGYSSSFSVENNLYGEFLFQNCWGFSGNIGFRPSVLSIKNVNFYSLQPRVLISYSPVESLSLKVSFSELNQTFHVLTSSSVGLKSDYRIPISNLAPPSKSNQYVAGLAFTPNKSIEFSIESYLKNTDNLVMKKEGVRYNLDYESWDKVIETNGRGRSVGIEFLARKPRGRFTGWMGITFSSSTNTFIGVNGGSPFPTDYDRPFEFNSYMQYSLNKRINFGVSWVYAMGNPSNIPSTYYSDLEGNNIFVYNGYNSSRQKDYHRMDISINLKGNRGDWNISLINAYNRKNPYYYEITNQGDIPVLKEHSLFSILPSVSYTFKF